MTVPARVLVVGSGLLGTSLGLALRRHGVVVHLRDADARVAGAAAARGAGTTDPPAGRLDLAAVAVPPTATAAVVSELLDADAARVVTDVASVKAPVLAAVAAAAGARARRYVPGHPMAGREVSGPAGAHAELFENRPWVLCAGPGTTAAVDREAVEAVTALVRLVGGIPLLMDAGTHDAAVARLSHAPHALSVLAAARLTDAPAAQLALAGTGVMDVTRVAAGDPSLWADILSANAAEVQDVLGAVRADLDRLLAALREGRPEGLAELLRAGAAGRSRLDRTSDRKVGLDG